MKNKNKVKKQTKFGRFIKENAFVFAAFFVAMILMLIVYYSNEVIPFGDRTVLRMDLFHQYGPLFGELYDRITGFKSFIYSWTSGGGSSFLGNYFNYLSSPVAIIILAFGHENIPDAIGAMVLIKNALAAATMAYYLKKSFKKNDFTVTAFGLMYAFCGFFIAYYWNIMWIDAMYLLPLVVLGIEKLINENKAKLYVASLAVTFFANYYMAFMVCVFSLIYFFAYFFSNHSAKDFTREPKKYVDKNGEVKTDFFDSVRKSLFLNRTLVFGFSSILSAALMAFALIPTYMILKTCSATSGVMPEELTQYNTVFDFLANHLASVVPTIRSSGDLVVPNVYSGMLTIILLPLYWFCRKIKVADKVVTTLTLGLFFFAFNFNIPNYIIHAFHFPNDLPFRFSFIYSFFLVLTAYKVLANIKSFTSKELLAGGMGVILFIIITEALGQANVDENTVAVSIIFTVIYTFVLWLFRNPEYQQSTVALLLMCCVFAEISVAETDRFEITQEKPNFVNGYEDFVSLKEKLDNREDGAFYRMEMNNLNTLMDNCWYGYNGVSMFSSMAYESFANLQDDLGIKSNYINSFVYNQNTPVYNAMMGLKYIVRNDFTEFNPEIYKEIASSGKFTAYENQYALPIAYCVNSDVLEWRAGAYGNPFLNQMEYLVKAAGVGDVFTPVEVSDYTLFSLDEENSFFSGTMFTFSKEDSYEDASAMVSYTIQKDGNAYAYVESESLDEATITCDGFELTQDLSEPYIADLGYRKAGEVIEIQMPISPDYYSGNIDCYVYTLKEETLDEVYDILKQGAMQNVTVTDTKVSGTVNAEEDCVLYTSIPYDSGWSVTIDGKKADIISLSNGALLAVELTEGEHEIELSYHAKGMTAGLCISGGALLFLILFLIIRKIVRKIKDKKKAVYFSPQKPEEEQKKTGIEALMEQDLGPDATAEDSEALLMTEIEIPEEEPEDVIEAEEITEAPEENDEAVSEAEKNTEAPEMEVKAEEPKDGEKKDE